MAYYMLEWIIAAILGNKALDEKLTEKRAAAQVRAWQNNEDMQRKDFFEKVHQIFSLFGNPDWDTGNVPYKWESAKEVLTLLEEGYYPIPHLMKYPISEEELNRFQLNGLNYKINPHLGNFANLHLHLSEVENYIENFKSIYYYEPDECKIYTDIRKLLYEGKVTIGVPFNSGGTFSTFYSNLVPHEYPKIMTFQEAREYMDNKIEEQFQLHLTKTKEYNMRHPI